MERNEREESRAASCRQKFSLKIGMRMRAACEIRIGSERKILTRETLIRARAPGNEIAFPSEFGSPRVPTGFVTDDRANWSPNDRDLKRKISRQLPTERAFIARYNGSHALIGRSAARPVREHPSSFASATHASREACTAPGYPLLSPFRESR